MAEKIIRMYYLTKGINQILMPKDAEPLHVSEHCGHPAVWVLAPYGTGLYMVEREFLAVPDGAPMKDFKPTYEYIGSCYIDDGIRGITHHVFEIT